MTGRRRFVRSAAMTLAAARLGMFGEAEAAARESREMAALGRATEWLNSPRLTPARLAGQVVLVDFCTYTCINWLRTLPYRRTWAQKYQPGLLLIGVHTPEFGFERDVANVRRAVARVGIEYPVVIDNDYAIWRAFDNHYWPALYFLDARGRIRRHHFGEGEYIESEKAIQRLLADSGMTHVPGGLVSVAPTGAETQADWDHLRSPETYLGYDRTERLAARGGARRDRPHTYAAGGGLALNDWTVAGEWTMGREAAVGRAQSRLSFRFHARDLHLVMGPPSAGLAVRFRVTLDGAPPGADGGTDLDASGLGMAREQRLFQLVRQTGRIRERTFEIEFLDTGVEAFAFTFG